MRPLAAMDPREIGGIELLGCLGEGGMGRVFLGRSRAGRLAAVKILRPERSSGAESLERFRREIKAAQEVSGAFTAPVLAAGPEDEPPWLATALGGPSLSDVIAELGPLPAGLVWQLAAGLAEVLENVHARRLVHRDLKPANILLDSDGVKVIDFGISRSSASTITSAGTLIGTVNFMSPEQVRGTRVGPSSDVFSLGCVLAFAAGGVSPYGQAHTVAAAVKILREAPDLSAVPLELRDLLTDCLAMDPAGRPAPAEIIKRSAVRSARVRAVVGPTTTGYWPEPVATFVGSWQRNLLSGVVGEPVRVPTRKYESTFPSPLGPVPGDPPRLRGDGPSVPLAPPDPEAAVLAAEGDRFRAQQRNTEAVNSYRASIGLDPADPEVHNDLGRALHALDQFADAEAAFREAVRLASGFVAARHNLFVTLLDRRRFADAEDACHEAIRAVPGDSAGYENLGDALWLQARRAAAADAYQRAVALDPGNSRIGGKLKQAREQAGLTPADRGGGRP